LRIAEQRAERARPVESARRPPSKPNKPSALVKLLRKCWNWLEQPEAPVPASRPLAANFYSQL
jgi:hypothetical protein